MNSNILNFLIPVFFGGAALFLICFIICLWRDVAYYSDLCDDLKEELGYGKEEK